MEAMACVGNVPMGQHFFNASLMCVDYLGVGKNDWQIMEPREGGVWIQAEL